MLLMEIKYCTEGFFFVLPMLIIRALNKRRYNGVQKNFEDWFNLFVFDSEFLLLKNETGRNTLHTRQRYYLYCLSSLYLMVI